MDKTEALLQHIQEIAAWLELQASDCKNGDARHVRGGQDDSADVAAIYRHRLGNTVSVIQAFRRLQAREG